MKHFWDGFEKRAGFYRSVTSGFDEKYPGALAKVRVGLRHGYAVPLHNYEGVKDDHAFGYKGISNYAFFVPRKDGTLGYHGESKGLKNLIENTSEGREALDKYKKYHEKVLSHSRTEA